MSVHKRHIYLARFYKTAISDLSTLQSSDQGEQTIGAVLHITKSWFLPSSNISRATSGVPSNGSTQGDRNILLCQSKSDVL